MNKHTDPTRPVDAPTDHTARYARHARHVLTNPATAARIMRDAWSGDPDTDRYWAHNND